MATFRCGKCGCNEDTALCNYWSARVRDRLPVCSACDPKIGKWHGQFPRVFGVLLVTPRFEVPPREALRGLVGRLQLADAGPRAQAQAELVEGRREVTQPGEVSGGAFVFTDFSDPVPAYRPLTASRRSAA
jgi:hypothetical protein